MGERRGWYFAVEDIVVVCVWVEIWGKDDGTFIFFFFFFPVRLLLTTGGFGGGRERRKRGRERNGKEV